MRRWLTWECLAIGVGMATVSGTVEYIMTDGISGWVPLIAGLAGVILGHLLAAPLIILAELLKGREEQQPVMDPLEEPEKGIFIRRLSVLRHTLQATCLEHERPMSADLCEEAFEVSQDLRSMEIETPDIVSIGTSSPRVWHSFLTWVIPALEIGDIEHARSALKRIDIPNKEWRQQ